MSDVLVLVETKEGSLDKKTSNSYEGQAFWPRIWDRSVGCGRGT